MGVTERHGEQDGVSRQPRYLRVAEDLRGRIGNEYKVDQPIPTQQALMARYGVSRVTAQRAMETLRSWGLIDEGGRGRRSRVIVMNVAPPTLAERVAVAFAAPHVSLDVWSRDYREAEQGRRSAGGAHRAAGEGSGARVDQGPNPAAESRCGLSGAVVDRRPRGSASPERRLRSLIRTFARQLEHSLLAAGEYQREASVRVEIRCVRALPLQKCYILNGSEALTSLYRVRKEQVRERADSAPMSIFDLRSGSEVFMWVPSADGGSEREGAYFEELRLLFESCWSDVAEPMDLGEMTSS